MRSPRDPLQALRAAILADDLSKVKSVLQDVRTDPNARIPDKQGNRVLHEAAKAGNAALIAVLLDKDTILANVTNERGVTPLHLAVQGDHLAAVKALLEKADPDIATRTGVTPLHIASARGTVAIVEALVGKASPDALDHKSLTPLAKAIINGHVDIVDVLLQRARPDHPNAEGTTPLHLAAMHGQSPIMRKLLRLAPPDQLDNARMTPLYVAAATDHGFLIEMLLEHGADPEIEALTGYRALHIAAALGHRDAVTTLLKKADPNVRLPDNGATPLHLAALSGFTDVVRALMDAGDPNLLMQDGRTALELAFENGYVKAIRVLLEKADPNVLLILRPGEWRKVIYLYRPIMPELDDLATDNERRIRIMERWAEYRAPTPAHEGFNKWLTARTNFHLSQLLEVTERNASVAPGPCDKGALFRLTLALEQILETDDDQERASEFAGKLLQLAPESKTYFNLAGVDVPRRDIEDLSRAQGEVARHRAMDRAMAQVRAGWGANVHLNGFLLLGRSLLDELDLRNQRATAAGITAPVRMGQLAARSATPISSAFSTGLHPELRLVLDQPKHKPAILDFLESDRSAATMPIASVLLDEIRILDRALVQSLSPRTDAAELDSRQCLAEVARLLDSLKIEANLDAQIVSEIECQTPRLSTEALDAPIRTHLRDNPDSSLAALASIGLRHTWAMSDPIREGGFATDTHSVLHTLWRYIQHQPQGDTRDKLLDMMILQLADIGVNPVCNTGCVQRLLMDAGAIDTTLVSHEPSDQVMQDLIQQIALRVTSSFDDDYMSAYGDAPNDPDKVIALKQDVTRASVIDDLVRRRGWRRDRVEAVLAPIIDQIRYL